MMNRCGQTTWRMSDRYGRLVTVAVHVLATSCWKHLSQASVLDSSSSRAVESIVWVAWTLCLCFMISFMIESYILFKRFTSRGQCVLNDSKIVINFLELWRHPHAKLAFVWWTGFDSSVKFDKKLDLCLNKLVVCTKIPNLIEFHWIVSEMKNTDRRRADRMISAIFVHFM
jgi:hypothetical protein